VATPKLLDFGIAKLKTNCERAQDRSGAPMGTPLYMSPEQVYGREIDHRSDIYSLGILIYEVLTGAPPFDGDSVMDVLTAQTTAKAPSLRSAAPELPAELDGPVHHMLEKSPEKRPQSVTAALDKLMLAAELSGVIPRSRAAAVPKACCPSTRCRTWRRGPSRRRPPPRRSPVS
jgi:serine/threonine-protein kinase